MVNCWWRAVDIVVVDPAEHVFNRLLSKMDVNRELIYITVKTVSFALLEVIPRIYYSIDHMVLPSSTRGTVRPNCSTPGSLEYESRETPSMRDISL